jgi:hypothetical protein
MNCHELQKSSIEKSLALIAEGVFASWFLAGLMDS